jgi:hypothetical protein
MGLIRRCGARDRQGDVFLRFKLGGVNRLGIEVKGRARLLVAQKLLNRLYVLTPANQEGREAVTKIVEAEPLPRFQANADLEGGGSISTTTIAGEKAAKKCRSLCFLELRKWWSKRVAP